MPSYACAPQHLAPEVVWAQVMALFAEITVTPVSRPPALSCTATGRWLSVLQQPCEPSPSSPSLLLPQQSTPVSDLRAQVWSKPTVIVVMPVRKPVLVLFRT